MIMDEFNCRGSVKPQMDGYTKKKKWANLSLTGSQNCGSHLVPVSSQKTLAKCETSANICNKNVVGKTDLSEEAPYTDFFNDTLNWTKLPNCNNSENVDYFKLICLDTDKFNSTFAKNKTSKIQFKNHNSGDSVENSILEDTKLKSSTHQTNSPTLFSSDSGGSYNPPNDPIKNKHTPTQKFERKISPLLDKNSEYEFSQLCKSTQVMKHLENGIRLNEKENLIRDVGPTNNSSVPQHPFKLPASNVRGKRSSSQELKCSIKVKKTHHPENPKENISKANNVDCVNESLWDNDIDFRMTQMFKSSQYRKQVSQLFEGLEQSICQLGTNKNAASDTVVWPEDSFMLDAVLNGLTQESNGTSIGDLVKKSLLENAAKSITPTKLVNNTLVTNEVAFRELGPFYGLPSKVEELIKLYKGINKLYDWQHECLNLPAVLQRRNLIYSLPTSGGKTLVAEVLILREIICRKRNVIFVLPYVAIVQEKVWALSPFGVALDFLIEEYAAGKGTCPPRKRRYKNSVFIATTEKALSLINSLVEHGRIEEIGLVVIDELHLIGEDKRGPKLETLLTKLMYLNEDIQIVGMSATIGNLQDICKFLNADVYSRNFRPVELIEYVKCGNQIAKVNYKASEENIFESVKTVNFGYSDALAKIDPDHLGGLILEVVPKGSCLIFCPSKKNCENVARLLCTVLLPKLKEHKAQEKLQLLYALKNEAETVCDILKLSIPFGIAYHHSGLTSEERRLIEEAYRAGVLSVICCTSTLAAGVNLPAKRVIIRKPYIAQNFINLSRYKQMVGRAGRAGLGELGESIVICTKNELPKIKEMFMLPMDQTLSKMHDNDGIHLRDLFLSCISLRTANTRTQLEKVTSKTLLAVQQSKLDVDLKPLAKKVLSDLFILGAVKTSKDSTKPDDNESETLNISVYSNNTETNSNSSKKSGKKRIVITNDTQLIVSKLGSAAIKGGLDMCGALTLYEDLSQAQESLVLIDCLHLLYLVTPYNLVEQVKPSKTQYHNIMSRLGDKERKTAIILGISESCIVRMLSNQSVKNVPERVLNRFYMSLMLFDLWNEVSIIDVSEKYQVTRGTVQNMMTAASTFAANVVSFCEELEEFWSFAYLLKGMCQRLSHCCTKELLSLMELPAVKQGRAKQLYHAGYKTLQSIAKADENELIKSIEFMSRRLAGQLIAAAKLLLLQKVETLREEAEDVLDGVENPLLIFNQKIVC